VALQKLGKIRWISGHRACMCKLHNGAQRHLLHRFRYGGERITYFSFEMIIRKTMGKANVDGWLLWGLKNDNSQNST